MTQKKKIFNQYNIISVLLLALLALGIGCATGPQRELSRAEEMERIEETRKEIGLGRLVAARIIARYGLYKNDKVRKYVNLVGKGLALYVGRPELNYNFAVLDSKVINAFAAPGGYIFITKGLLREINDEAELASVLAHEIAHINKKHIIKTLRMPKASKTFAERIAAILGARDTLISSVFGKVAEQAQNMLFEKGYKRQDEFEADEFGLQYAAMTGYDVNGLVRFLNILEKMEVKLGKKKAYSTHPEARERLSKVEAIKNRLGISGGKRVIRRYQKMKLFLN